MRALPRATAAMTARITVEGQDAVDDHPDAGHNATVLLGFLAQHLAARLDGAVPGTRVCVAGLHTGRTHNRVHGTGTLLLNLSYRRTADGDRLKTEVTRHLADGLRRLRRTLRRPQGSSPARRGTRNGSPGSAGTNRACPRWTTPTRGPRNSWPAQEPGRPAGDPGFTCDAIWAAGLDDAFTTVLGPGCLAANRAHAPGEFIDLADLEEFAAPWSAGSSPSSPRRCRRRRRSDLRRAPHRQPNDPRRQPARPVRNPV